MTSDPLPPIKGFIETSFLDWPGQVCAVVFLPYCNFRCPYCHNHRLVLEPDALETIALRTVLERVATFKGWTDGICVTGGEPTIHRGLPALLREIRNAGFKTKVDTNGTQPEMLQYLIAERLVDCVAMDVKAPLDDAVYARCAGVYVPADIIAASIKVLMQGGVSTVFRCTVTPALLAQGDVCSLAEQLKALWTEGCFSGETTPRLTLQNFNPADPMDTHLKDVKPFAEKALSRMQQKVDRILS